MHNHPRAPPRAAVTIYGALDLSVPPAEKLRNRPYKQGLPPPRGDATDPLARLADAFDWGYIPQGQDLRDPLLSPAYAAAGALPPFVGVVACELDMLAHESWRLACRLSREGGNKERVVPRRGQEEELEWRVVGNARGEVVVGKGELAGEGDERYGFEERWEGGGVKWLLVPDVLHGFDNVHIRAVVGGVEAMEDAVVKTGLYVDEMARWLKEVVWEL